MSRHFSSVVRAAARILWSFNGTTKNLERDVAAVEQAVLANPELAKKVKKGVINGDPHPTKYADGTEDPIHISGILGEGNLKGSKRATSFHYYPETGDIRFSNSRYPPVRIGTSNATLSNVAAESSSSASAQAITTTDLTWRTNEQTNCAEWWDGAKWVEGDWSHEYQKWYACYNGEWYYW